MSWWVSLENEEGELFEVDEKVYGGTYEVGGTLALTTLNVTYNYSTLFQFKKELNGKKASDTLSRLEEMVNVLGFSQDKDYWASTPGNVGYACLVLLGWAREFPKGIWRVN